MGEACTAVVMALTSRHQLPLADGLKAIDAREGAASRPMVGQATVVVSHSPQCKLSELILTLDAYAAERPVERNYFWVSLFCCGHHQKGPDTHQAELEAAIAATKRTCVVLAPWADSLALNANGAWRGQHCLWDMFTSLRYGATYVLQLSPSEAPHFERALLSEFDAGAPGAAHVTAA